MAGQQFIYSGQGPILLGDFDATNGKAASGYMTNLRKVSCVSSVLKTTMQVEKKKIKESCSGQRLTKYNLLKTKGGGVELTLHEFDRDAMAMALYGTAVVVASGTVTGETFPTVAVGDTVMLKHPNVSSVVVKDSAGSPATLTSGTHYTPPSAAPNHGDIEIVNLASYVQPLKADYSYAGYSNIVAMSANNVIKGLVFKGINTGDGNKPVRLMIPKIDWDPSDYDWLGDEESPLTLKGEMMYVAELASDGSYGPFMRVDALPSA